MTARRVLSLLCLAACAAALVGCGGDTFSFDPVAKRREQDGQSTSSRVAFTATMDIDGVGGMAFSGSGVFDGRSRSGALNMRFTMPAADAVSARRRRSHHADDHGRPRRARHVHALAALQGNRGRQMDQARHGEAREEARHRPQQPDEREPGRSISVVAHADGFDRRASDRLRPRSRRLHDALQAQHRSRAAGEGQQGAPQVVRAAPRAAAASRRIRQRRGSTTRVVCAA